LEKGAIRVSQKEKTHFQKAVEQTPEIRDFYKPGLQALRHSERQHICCGDSKRLTGSLSLDDAFKKTHPNEPVWDYAVGYNHFNKGDKVTWIEFHPASSDHVAEVLRKLSWLKNWLTKKAVPPHSMTDRYCWVATGRIVITANSKQAKVIASRGLEGPMKQVVLR